MRNSFHNTQTMIAAYVSLADTGELRYVQADLYNTQMSRVFWKLYYSGFEVASKDHTTAWAPQDTIFKKILPGIIPKARDAIRASKLPISKDLFTYNDPHYRYVSIVIFIYFII